ncbi:MAG TPA: hypothetical protein VF469_38535 [Kofleriaceae bacterium]
MTVAVAAVALGGCVDGFRGSNVQLDLFTGAVPVQAHVMGAPAPGELPANVHFSIYAIQQDSMQDRLFEVARFEVHRIVDPSSPCFIDVGEHVPHPGLHVSQYAAKIAEDTGITSLANPPPNATEQQKELAATAVQRQANVGLLASSDMGIVAVTSASTSSYPAVAGGCSGPPDQVPPPMCTDDASNQLRLKLCQAAWKADPNLWEGTDRVLTAPLAGITRGMVNGTNPISHTPVGGAQFFVDNALVNIDAYAIYFQVDGMDTPGTQLFFGKPTMPTRGVQHVNLVSPINPLAQAKMAVFADLGQDDVHF